MRLEPSLHRTSMPGWPACASDEHLISLVDALGCPDPAAVSPEALPQAAAELGLLPWSIALSPSGPSLVHGWAQARLVQDLSRREGRAVLMASDLADFEQACARRLGPHGWRNERHALVLADGRASAELGLERSLFRPLGLLSQSVQITLWRPDGLVWLAQRAAHKAIDPGLWDAAVAGGLPMREDPRSCAVREAWEEAGIPEAACQGLQAHGRVRVCRRLPDRLHLERVALFSLAVALDFEPRPLDGEVAGFEAVSPEGLAERLMAGQFNYEAGLASLVTLARLRPGQ